MDRHIVYMGLGELTPALRNPKDHDLPSLCASLDRYGWTEPAVLDERTGRLVAGHGRREAAIVLRQAGESMPAGMLLAEDGEWRCPVVRGWSSRDDTEAEAYIIASNRLTEAGGWHVRELAKMLEDVITADAPLIETLGYTDEDIDAILRQIDPESLNPDPDAPALPALAEDEEAGGVAEVDADLDEEPVTTRDVTCPSCQHLFGVPA